MVTMADCEESGTKMLLASYGHWLMTACEADDNFMLAYNIDRFLLHV